MSESIPPVEAWPDDVRDLCQVMGDAVGSDTAIRAMAALLSHCPGRQLYIPSFDRYRQDQRRQRIAHAIEAGMTTSQITSSFGVDRSTVARIRRSLL